MENITSNFIINSSPYS